VITKTKKEICFAVVLVLTSVILAMYFLSLWGHNLNVPINYNGDTLPILRFIKTISNTGSVFFENRLGAPFEAVFVDYEYFGSSVHYFIMTLIYKISGSVGLAINLYFIMLFPLTSLVSYFAMKNLRINSIAAFFGSLSYTFLFFRLARNIAHLLLSAYTLVPAGIMLLFWLANDEKFFKLQKSFFCYKKNIVGILLIALFSLSGIYYDFFLAFFLCAILLILLLKNINDWKQLLFRFAVFLSAIIIPLVLDALPTYINKFKLGAIDNSSLITRNITDVERYALKIWRLLIPVPDAFHRIPILQKFFSRLHSGQLFSGESTEYIGILGALGFFVLLVTLISNVKIKATREIDNIGFHRDNLVILSKLNICGILLASVGGFSFIFANTITYMIRGYERISVFIAFFCIMGACIFVTMIIEMERHKTKKIVFMSLFIVVSVATIINQGRSYDFKGILQNSTISYNNDRRFIGEIDDRLSEDAMVYQFPYVDLFGHRYAEKIGEYGPSIGFIHSNGLKWSYGDFNGRRASLWHNTLSTLSTLDILNVLSIVGFEGVFIDRRAYDQESLEKLENTVKQLTDIQPVVSEYGFYVFYDLNVHKNFMQKNLSEEQLDRFKSALLENPLNYYSITHELEFLHQSVGLNFPVDINLASSSESYNRGNYSIEGLSIAEPEYTWTEGENLNIKLYLGANSCEYDISIEINAIFLPSVQKVFVYANNIEAGVFVNDGSVINNIIVSKELLVSDELNEILFCIIGADSPKNIGINQDPRILGLAISSISFTQIVE
jgi:phosphoglycerol transferase